MPLPQMNRREFAGSVMLAALAPVLETGAFPLGGEWREAAMAWGGGDVDELAKALAGVVRAQYGSRLAEADVTAITRQIRNGLERAEAMRKVELANGDEPDFVFSAAPGSGR